MLQENLKRNGGFTEAELEVVLYAVKVFYSKTTDWNEEKVCMDIINILENT